MERVSCMLMRLQGVRALLTLRQWGREDHKFPNLTFSPYFFRAVSVQVRTWRRLAATTSGSTTWPPPPTCSCRCRPSKRSPTIRRTKRRPRLPIWRRWRLPILKRVSAWEDTDEFKTALTFITNARKPWVRYLYHWRMRTLTIPGDDRSLH